MHTAVKKVYGVPIELTPILYIGTSFVLQPLRQISSRLAELSEITSSAISTTTVTKMSSTS